MECKEGYDFLADQRPRIWWNINCWFCSRIDSNNTGPLGMGKTWREAWADYATQKQMREREIT